MASLNLIALAFVGMAPSPLRDKAIKCGQAELEHYKQRPRGEAWPDLPNRNNCKLDPGYDARLPGTLQSATFVMKRGVEDYGDVYYLAVFADRRWAGEDVVLQRYAAVVELMHEGEVQLYQQSRQYEELRQRQRERSS